MFSICASQLKVDVFYKKTVIFVFLAAVLHFVTDDPKLKGLNPTYSGTRYPFANGGEQFVEQLTNFPKFKAGNTEGSITVLLTSCLTGLESAV